MQFVHLVKRAISISREDIFDCLRLSCQLNNIMEQVMAYKIIKTKAEEMDLEVSTAELQQAADEFRLTKNLIDVRDTKKWLQKHSLSLDDFENLVYFDLLAKKLINSLFADSVECWFDLHQNDYTQAAIYEVDFKDINIARELFSALNKGEISFHEIARQYITQPSLRRAGGYRGVLYRQELEIEVASAVFTATPPEFLQPIVTPKGVHLILVEEIIEPQLDESMRAKILAELFSQWLRRQVQELAIITDVNINIRSLLNELNEMN